MSEIEDLEKQLQKLKKQREDEIKKNCIERAVRAGKDEKTAFEQCTQYHVILSKIEELEKRLTDLKKQREKLDKKLEELEPECPECTIKKAEEETDEECPACEFAVGIGMYLNVYRDLDSEENCQDLFEKVTNGEISPEEFFNIIKEKAKDKPKQLDMLECIDELMEESSGKSESQKEGV